MGGYVLIRILFFIIIAAVMAAIAGFGFKSVPRSKKITIAGGGIAAAGIAILLQTGVSLMSALLSLVAISLGAAFVYMKILEKEKEENLRLAEARKEQRRSLIKPTAVEEPVLRDASEYNEDEFIAKEKQESVIEEVETEKETVPPSFGMQSMGSLGKERSRE